MTVLSPPKLLQDKKEKVNGNVSNGLESILDLTEVVPRIVKFVSDSSGGYYTFPSPTALKQFSVLMNIQMNSYHVMEEGRFKRKEMDLYTIDPERIPKEEKIPIDPRIKEHGRYRTIMDHYVLFCQALRTKSIYYPCVGKPSEDIKRRREQLALKETFCAFFKGEEDIIGKVLSNTT
jgi:hypothetical protein